MRPRCGGTSSYLFATLRIAALLAMYSLLGGVVDAQSGPYGVVSPTSVNFGQVLVGQTSPQQRVSLKNTGTSELIVSSISISGDFALPVNHCAAGVRPGTHCDVYLTFTPPVLGAATGTLTFTDNASNSPQTVSLSGTGANTVATKTKVTASPRSILAGQPITFTATVASLGGGTIPDGDQVYFFTSYGGLGYGTLQGGVAVLTTSAVHGIGQTTEKITAQYLGDQNFYSSQGSVDISVTKWTEIVTVTSSANPSMVWEPFTLTATLTGGPYTPTGSLCFGYYTHCTQLVGGVAVEPYPAIKTAGNFTIPVRYGGDDYNAPYDGSYEQVVDPSTTTTTIKSSKNPSTQGQAVTFSVAVKAPWAHVVDGSVTFSTGTTILGTVELSNSRGSITVSSLPAGLSTITATYTPPNGNFLGSSASLVQTVK